MKNEVYGTMTLDVSVDVESDNAEMALMEADDKYNEMRFIDCELYLTDRNGIIHKINIHNFKIKLIEFMN